MVRDSSLDVPGLDSCLVLDREMWPSAMHMQRDCLSAPTFKVPFCPAAFAVTRKLDPAQDDYQTKNS